MSIDSFPTEFTNDLESFVKTPIQFTPLTAWDERRIAAPERHFQNGIRESYSPTVIAFLLERHNPAFDTIENLLHLFFQTSNYTSDFQIHPEKEQCWLFGWKWLSAYYHMLTMPNILKSVFYKYENTRFLSLMGSLLHPDPTARIDFRTALEIWYPKSLLLVPPEPVEFALFDESVAQPEKRKRLVLKQPELHEERNKTRKNR
jgi:hypothetical protein